MTKFVVMRSRWTLDDLAVARFAAEAADYAAARADVKRNDEEPVAIRPQRERYQEMRADFEEDEGQIVQEWWSGYRPAGVVLTYRPLFRRGPLRSVQIVSTLYRSTAILTGGFPECGRLLYRGDNLALRSSEVLRGSPQRVALARLFGLASALLEVIDNAKLRAHWSLAFQSELAPRAENEAAEREAEREEAEREAAVEREVAHATEEYERGLDATEAYYHTTAVRSAQFDYFRGVGNGVAYIAGVVALAVLIADLALTWSGIAVPAQTYASLIAAVIAGALGSCVSVMWRMSTGDFVSDYEAGREHLRMIGTFRPFIGAVFGLAIYFAIQANLVSFGNDNPDFYLLTFIAFLSGFSERFAPDVLRSIEGRGQPVRSSDNTRDASIEPTLASRPDASAMPPTTGEDVEERNR